MQIKDTDVTAVIVEISDHYRSNIASPHIRPLLMRLPLDKWVWNSIDAFLEHAERFCYQGYRLEELYLEIIALTHLIDTAKRQMLPNLKNWVAAINGPDKFLIAIAANTFPSNIDILAELILRLYHKLIDFDKNATKNKQPIYRQFTDLGSIEKMLSIK
jgi:hypothetical protein